MIFIEILQFIHNSTPFAATEFGDVVRHLSSTSLMSSKDIESDLSDLITKFDILGVKKEAISNFIAPWKAQELTPDFILLAKIFKKGK